MRAYLIEPTQYYPKLKYGEQYNIVPCEHDRDYVNVTCSCGEKVAEHGIRRDRFSKVMPQAAIDENQYLHSHA